MPSLPHHFAGGLCRVNFLLVFPIPFTPLRTRLLPLLILSFRSSSCAFTGVCNCFIVLFGFFACSHDFCLRFLLPSGHSLFAPLYLGIWSAPVCFVCYLYWFLLSLSAYPRFWCCLSLYVFTCRHRFTWFPLCHLFPSQFSSSVLWNVLYFYTLMLWCIAFFFRMPYSCVYACVFTLLRLCSSPRCG